MVQAKSELFDAHSQELANIFKALSHPARIDILKFLAKSNSCYSGNIADELPLGRTTVNQHLTELKNAGLIKGTVSGSKVNYCLCGASIKKLKDLAFLFLEELSINENNNC